MEPKLFSPITFNQVTLKNRIAMSPMCMYSCYEQDGIVTPFHITHYESRAVGQVGLVMVEATAVQPNGRISYEDLGIWSDEHITGLKSLTERIHAHGAKSSIQLAHAGRKAELDDPIVAPSALQLNERFQTPHAMTKDDIAETIRSFQLAAERAQKANFDIIEIHGAHGYLINQFLSPLTNKRDDEYGGSRDNRYRFLKEIVDAIQEVWDGPIFVRLSTSEYHEEGNQLEDIIYFANQLHDQGIDLIDCSSGGVVRVKINPYPGYQVTFAEAIKQQAGIKTGAVGLITNGMQAEEIIQNNRADLVFIGRELLKNPYWPKQAADELQTNITSPKQYQAGWR
ncbi:NADPH dehydrogenase NamA [Alkalibacillus haloalkaliphilus]|uniref:NADPH dehydrogenase NamA n=1 Tax=Alkalibacillus haloalkaliphilus TaxID=94136 RepID=UPI0029362608|nr:NADPH dehydrogenase NamA [Alkalibacillus haloalkaliphilus]MDV2580894.1 NADPH dehydrogenase NamA [Alkalibacillus haloalkaliphilus]